MRNEMQNIKILSELLDKTIDPVERERIQDEIWALEEDMEFDDDLEYKINHHNKFIDN